MEVGDVLREEDERFECDRERLVDEEEELR